LFECHSVMLGDGSQANVNFVLVVFGADVERRAGLRHRAEPVFSGDVRNVFLQLDYAFAGAAFSREQPWLIERYAVFNRPFSLLYWLTVPFRHIEPLERKPRRAFRPFPTRFSFLPDAG